VAKTLTGTLRPTDIVGRWGGDEFIAVAHHVNIEILTHLGERCGAMVAQSSFPSSKGGWASVSVSIRPLDEFFGGVISACACAANIRSRAKGHQDHLV
jgi:GGDEF domain-containing protein